MKVYVVNLKKNPERMESIDAQLKKLGVEYERIEAVYGKELSEEEYGRSVSSLHAFLARGRKLTDGEVGCALSHLEIYRRMIAKRIPVATVLEDDIIVKPEFAKVLSEVEVFVDVDKPQIVMLSTLGSRDAGKTGIVKTTSAICTDGYVITLPAAKIILRANYPVVTVADSWSRWRRRYGLETYRYCPSVVSQDIERFGTDVSPVKQQIGGGVRYVMHKLLRVVEVLADKIWFWVSGR